jgi:hypothetical protein
MGTVNGKEWKSLLQGHGGNSPSEYQFQGKVFHVD